MTPYMIFDDPNYDEWCEQEIIRAYKDAAEYDQFLFGDYNYTKVWLDINTNDIV